MKTHTVKLKNIDMQCHKCLLNILRALSQLDGIKELDVSLETKAVKIVYGDDILSGKIIREIVSRSIINRKLNVNGLLHHAFQACQEAGQSVDTVG